MPFLMSLSGPHVLPDTRQEPAVFHVNLGYSYLPQLNEFDSLIVYIVVRRTLSGREGAWSTCPIWLECLN